MPYLQDIPPSTPRPERSPAVPNVVTSILELAKQVGRVADAMRERVLSDEEFERLCASIKVLTPKDVLVIRQGWGEWADVWSEVARRMGTLVILLAEGQGLESLNESEMAEHGWIRKPEEPAP
jgi:hypothetical protein